MRNDATDWTRDASIPSDLRAFEKHGQGACRRHMPRMSSAGRLPKWSDQFLLMFGETSNVPINCAKTGRMFARKWWQLEDGWTNPHLLVLVFTCHPRDGAHRRYSDELGYDCPEIGEPNLDEEEDQTLGRARTLARRQLTQDQRRELIADQLEESPERSNRWLAKQLGVSDRGGSARRFGGNWPNYSVGPNRGGWMGGRDHDSTARTTTNLRPH